MTAQKIEKNKPENVEPVIAKIPKKMASLQQELMVQILTLRLVVLGLVIALIVAIYSLSNVTNDITVHIPPNLSEGVTMKAGDYPRANVLTNTSYLWISINTWLENGQVDAKKNLIEYQNYMSAQFIEDLQRALDARQLDRTRRLTLVPGVLSDFSKRVRPLTNNSWVVYIDVIEEEWFLGERVRHSKVRYPIKVEQVTSTADINPIELKLVGFQSPPTVIEEL